LGYIPVADIMALV